MSDLASLDLNLLRVLSALLETRSVTRTGESLGLSQPAASRAVARLRRALGDPLLVRTSSGYVLTPHLESLRPRVTAALSAVVEVLAPAVFDATTTTRVFQLATTDYGAMTVLTGVAPRFMELSPEARLDVHPWTEGTLGALESGALDLVLYADSPLPPDFHYRDLFVETYACVVRRGHPLTRASGRAKGRAAGRSRGGAGKGCATQREASPPLAAFAAYPRVLIVFPDGRSTSADDLLSRLGFPAEKVPLRLPYFMAAPWIVAASDLVLTAPKRIAERLAQAADLEVFPLPADVESFPYRMVWHERGHRDPAQRWLRSLILDLVRDLQ